MFVCWTCIGRALRLDVGQGVVTRALVRWVKRDRLVDGVVAIWNTPGGLPGLGGNAGDGGGATVAGGELRLLSRELRLLLCLQGLLALHPLTRLGQLLTLLRLHPLKPLCTRHARRCRQALGKLCLGGNGLRRRWDVLHALGRRGEATTTGSSRLRLLLLLL